VEGRPLEVEAELLEAFRRSGAASGYLFSILPPGLWRRSPPGGRGRSIAAIAAHMQSVRRMFARMGGARPGPPSLDRKTVTIAQARNAIRQSTDLLATQFEKALEERRSRVAGMPRRVVDMLTYLMQHDAHHRGQICTLARDLGHEFAAGEMARIWGWKAMGNQTEIVESRSSKARRSAMTK